MKKILKLLLFVAIGLVVLVVGFLGYIAISGIPSYEPQEVAFTPTHTPGQVAKGAKLANMVCAPCHRNISSVVLTGRLVEDIDPVFGEMYS
ncbi:hypothetical protein R9C00_11560 [Flammeovirgaceae bacterium SG7u.111]|nr:hypothetical protein [Flammeovirgaceae bacterium SG7u.132]WPO38089.1 hypothetical protein R9C00_11560 [Flammeovirgaceae bacterium SG7u.111]